jgi:glutamate-1-semialdehyde 2,1-aminomutase
VDQIVVATSVDVRNQPLVEHVCKLGYAEQGNENDVDRFAKQHGHIGRCSANYR